MLPRGCVHWVRAVVKERQDARSHLLEADKYCLPGTAWGSYSREVTFVELEGKQLTPGRKALDQK